MTENKFYSILYVFIDSNLRNSDRSDEIREICKKIIYNYDDDHRDKLFKPKAKDEKMKPSELILKYKAKFEVKDNKFYCIITLMTRAALSVNLYYLNRLVEGDLGKQAYSKVKSENVAEVIYTAADGRTDEFIEKGMGVNGIFTKMEEDSKEKAEKKYKTYSDEVEQRKSIIDYELTESELEIIKKKYNLVENLNNFNDGPVVRDIELKPVEKAKVQKRIKEEMSEYLRNVRNVDVFNPVKREEKEMSAEARKLRNDFYAKQLPRYIKRVIR